MAATYYPIVKITKDNGIEREDFVGACSGQAKEPSDQLRERQHFASKLTADHKVTLPISPKRVPTDSVKYVWRNAVKENLSVMAFRRRFCLTDATFADWKYRAELNGLASLADDAGSIGLDGVIGALPVAPAAPPEAAKK